MNKDKNGRKSMRNIICAAAAAAALTAAAVLSGCAKKTVGNEPGKVEESRRLTVYTSHKQEVYDPIIREFEERTGIWVQVKTGGTTELLEEIREKSGSYTCDIMFGGGVESYEVYKDCFLPYKSGQSDMLDETFVSSEEKWTVFTKLPIVFIYNNKLVESDEAPKGWADLFEDRWRGQIAFADPARSGSSCTVLTTMIQILGKEEDKTLSAFAGALDGKMSGGSGSVLEEVAAGSRLVGITLEETAKKYIARGADISIVYPAEGTSAVPDGCAIVSGAVHEENAKLFLDFIVGKDAQSLAVDRLYRRTVRTDIPETASDDPAKIMDFDLDWAVGRQEEILKKWAGLMGKAEGK